MNGLVLVCPRGLAALCVLLALLGLAACAPRGAQRPVAVQSGSAVLEADTYAGDAIAVQLNGRMPAGSLIVAASFVDLERLDETSGLGRLAASHIGSRLAQLGWPVVEARLRGQMAFRLEQGEFLLSRDTAKLLITEHNAEAALVGYYTRTSRRAYVSARVVRLSDGATLGACEYYLNSSAEVRQLLAPRGSEGAVDDFARRGQAFPEAVSTAKP